MKQRVNYYINNVSSESKKTYTCRIDEEYQIILSCRKNDEDQLYFENEKDKVFLKGVIHSAYKESKVIDEFKKGITLFSDIEINLDYNSNSVYFKKEIKCSSNVIEGLRIVSKMTKLMEYVESLIKNKKKADEFKDVTNYYDFYIPSSLQYQFVEEMKNHCDFILDLSNGNSLFFVNRIISKNEENYRNFSNDHNSFKKYATNLREKLIVDFLYKYKNLKFDMKGLDFEICTHENADIAQEYYYKINNPKKGMCIRIDTDEDSYNNQLFVYLSNIPNSHKRILELINSNVFDFDVVANIQIKNDNEANTDLHKLVLKTNFTEKTLDQVLSICNIVSTKKG